VQYGPATPGGARRELHHARCATPGMAPPMNPCHLQAFLQRVAARPAVKAAMQAEGLLG